MLWLLTSKEAPMIDLYLGSLIILNHRTVGCLRT